MTMRKPADFFMIQTMLIICITWSLQQIFIKLAANDITPIMQASLRNGIAALLVGLMIVIKKGWSPSWKGTLKPGIITGIIFAGEFLFIALGLQYTSASHIAIFLYTGPIFTALGLNFFVATERLKPLQWIGITICFIGIVTAFGSSLLQNEIDITSLLGDFFGLLAGLFLGSITVIIRSTKLSEAPPTLTLFYQLLIGFIILLIIALISGQSAIFHLTPIAISSLIFQGVIVSFISYLIWFWLLRKYVATTLTIFTLMTPIFGVGFGVLILNDKLTTNFIIGAIFILLGILFVSNEATLSRFIKRLHK